MYRIDNATAATVMPTPAAPGPRPNGFFTKGNPTTPVAATIVDDDWLNNLQEEICTVIAAGGIALHKNGTHDLLDALRAIMFGGQQAFYASGTFTVPAGVTRLEVEVWGGGGGGSGGADGGAGGGGGYAVKRCAVTPGQSITVTIGTAGSGGAVYPGAAGGNGGTSSFGAFCSATGGTGGYGGGGLGGVGAGGDIVGSGQIGMDLAATFNQDAHGGLTPRWLGYGNGGGANTVAPGAAGVAGLVVVWW